MHTISSARGGGSSGPRPAGWVERGSATLTCASKKLVDGLLIVRCAAQKSHRCHLRVTYARNEDALVYSSERLLGCRSDRTRERSTHLGDPHRRRRADRVNTSIFTEASNFLEGLIEFCMFGAVLRSILGAHERWGSPAEPTRSSGTDGCTGAPT